MSDFVHCNKCYVIPGTNRIKFWLTSCTHIFCTRCNEQVTKDRVCLVCRSRCTVAPIDSTLKPEVRSYFEPIERLLNKLHKVEKFQRGHRANLFKHLGSMTSQEHVDLEKWENKISSLKKEIQDLRDRLKNSKKRSSSSSVYSTLGPSSGHMFQSPRRPEPLHHHHQTSSSSGYGLKQRYSSTFNQSSRLDPVTPMVKRNNLESPHSRGSSKITLRSSPSTSTYQAR